MVRRVSHARGVAEIVDLPPDKCEQLLRAGVFGRIAFCRETGPEIVPVNYAVIEDAILVRTSPGSLLDRYADVEDLVFEVDGTNYERWYGWSVIAHAVGERLTADELTEQERRMPGPPAWVTREEECWIRLRWTALSGRRLGHGWSPLAEMPVRRAWR